MYCIRTAQSMHADQSASFNFIKINRINSRPVSGKGKTKKLIIFR